MSRSRSWLENEKDATLRHSWAPDYTPASIVSNQSHVEGGMFDEEDRSDPTQGGSLERVPPLVSNEYKEPKQVQNKILLNLQPRRLTAFHDQNATLM